MNAPNLLQWFMLFDTFGAFLDLLYQWLVGLLCIKIPRQNFGMDSHIVSPAPVTRSHTPFYINLTPLSNDAEKVSKPINMLKLDCATMGTFLYFMMDSRCKYYSIVSALIKQCNICNLSTAIDKQRENCVVERGTRKFPFFVSFCSALNRKVGGLVRF